LIQAKDGFPIFTKRVLFLSYFDNLSGWAFDLINSPKPTKILFIDEISITHIEKRLKEEGIGRRLTVPFDDDPDNISTFELIVYNLDLTFELQTKVTAILQDLSLSLHPILDYMLFLVSNLRHAHHFVRPVEDILSRLLICYG
jgi:hypothetical protein